MRHQQFTTTYRSGEFYICTAVSAAQAKLQSESRGGYHKNGKPRDPITHVALTQSDDWSRATANVPATFGDDEEDV